MYFDTISSMEPKTILKPVVLRRRSSNYPGQGKRIHGIVFDHPSMPKIMAVSSVSRPTAQQHQRTTYNQDRYAAHGPPPSLIHSPSSLKIPSTGESPVADAARQQPSSCADSSTSYQNARAGHVPNYGHPSTSRTNTRALVSEGTTTTEHSRLPLQQEGSMIRYPTTSRNQNERHEPTSVRNDVVDLRGDQRRAMTASRVSYNPETVALHPRVVTQPMSHKQYSPATQPEHPQQHTRFHLAQHVMRRNSTGALRHHPGNGNANSAATFERRRSGETQGDFSRQFHYNVWQQCSGDVTSEIALGHGTNEGHQVVTGDHVVVMAPTSVVGAPSPTANHRSCVPTGDSTFDADQFRRKASWNSHPVMESPQMMAASRTDKKDAYFHQPPSQTGTFHGSLGAARGSIAYAKDRSGYEETELQVKQEITEEERDLRKPKPAMVVISDSEDEEDLSHALETSPRGDWEDGAGSDVFPVEDELDERENELPVEPVILLGGLISTRVKVKSEEVSGEESLKVCAKDSIKDCTKVCTKDSTKDSTKDCGNYLQRKKIGRFYAACCPSNGAEKKDGSWKSRHRSLPCEGESTKHLTVKESLVLCEQMLCSGAAKAKHSVDVDQRSRLGDFRVTVENGSRGVVNVSWSSSRRDSGVDNNNNNNNSNNNNNAHTSNGERFSVDENHRHVSFSCCERDIKSLDKACTERAKETAISSKCPENARCSEKATREDDCGPSLRTEKFSRCECHGRSSGDFENVPRKTPRDVSEKTGTISSINRSLSPTFGFLTRQLSKLTDDEMQIELKKDERVLDVGTGAIAKTGEAETPCRACVKENYATDKIPGNSQRNGQRSTTPGYRPRDECDCRSCDYSTVKPKNKAKLSEVTSQKIGNKPTGIVVGVKKDRHVSGTKDGGETKCKETEERSANVEKTACEDFAKGFGLLQFSVVEKDVEVDDALGKNVGGSRDNGLTSQQWGAYSVKLEKGDLDKRHEEMERLDGGKLDGQEIVGRNISEDVCDGVVDGNPGSTKCEVPEITAGDNNLHGDSKGTELGESGTFAAFQNLGSADAKKVDVFEATRKRPNSDVLESRVEFDAGDDCRRTRSPEECKRQKTTKGDVCGENDGGVPKDVISTAGDESVPKLSPSVEPKANCDLVAEQKTNQPRVLPRVLPDQMNGEKCAEKKSALTAVEWKEILVGRIEQVRESIEVEQTPWKTKNKSKVLKKLEKQLEWLDRSSSLDERIYISRRLQFFQTMRNQYELMKKIGGQRHTLKKTSKTNVLNVANITNEEKRTKPTSLLPSEKKREQSPVDNIKNGLKTKKRKHSV